MDAARRLYAEAALPWIDLSTGINPRPYPLGTIPAAAWAVLPEAEPLAALEALAAAHYGCSAGAEVVAAPGTQAIIQHLPGLLPGRDVRVLGPTYGEFARVYAAAAQPVAALRDLAGADVAVVVNPNNPDGRLLEPAALVALAAQVGALVVDEAFADTLGAGQSVVPHATGSRMIVLRSFGKFYGLAGLRLGFAVAAPEAAARLRARLGPWAVSGPALLVGARALADETWQAATRSRLAHDAGCLDATLTRAGLALVGGTSLFRLARHARAPSLFHHLARAGILTRPFANEATWLRFGLPGSAAASARLEAALAAYAR